MAYSLIANTIKGTTNFNDVTTDAIDTTGANLIYIALSRYSLGNPETVSDSKSNTWTQVTTADPDFGGQDKVIGYYCANPTVGSGHTFSSSGTTDLSTIQVSAWSGAASSPLDQENQNGATGTSIQPGSITPSEDNELILSAYAVNVFPGTDTYSIDSGFSILDQSPGSSAAFGLGVAYKIQTSATAVNPTWSTNGSSQHQAAKIISFKAAAGATGGGFLVQGALLDSGRGLVAN